MANVPLDGADAAGRRANGLPASDWGALVDLDPRLSEGLLDRLAAAGVAAYVEPATAVDTVHRAVTMPPRPLDRLWVDPSCAESAREVVASEVADLTALLAEGDPGATAHGLVHAVPSSAARRVLQPPPLPGPPALPRAAQGPDQVPPGDAAPTEPGSAEPRSGDAGATGTGPTLERPTPPRPPGGPAVPLSDDDVFAQLVAQFHSGVVHRRDTGSAGTPSAGTAPGPLDAGTARTRPARDPDAPPDPGDRTDRTRRTDRTDRTDPGSGTGADSGQRADPAARRDPGAAAQHRRRTDPPPAAATPALPGWLEPEALEDDGHYVPPPPPPVPRLRARTVAAVLALVLGLLLLFAPGLLRLPETTGTGLLGLSLLAGGAAALVWWMRDSSGGGPDDGAVV